MRKHIKGIDASPGVAIGKVFLYKEVEVVLSETKVTCTETEVKRLIDGEGNTKIQFEEISENTRKQRT